MRKTVVSAQALEGTSLSRLNLKGPSTLAQILKWPEIHYNDLKELNGFGRNLEARVVEQVEIETKYEGYIQRQLQQIERFKRLEEKEISQNLDYSAIPDLSPSARPPASRTSAWPMSLCF